MKKKKKQNYWKLIKSIAWSGVDGSPRASVSPTNKYTLQFYGARHTRTSTYHSVHGGCLRVDGFYCRSTILSWRHVLRSSITPRYTIEMCVLLNTRTLRRTAFGFDSDKKNKNKIRRGWSGFARSGPTPTAVLRGKNTSYSNGRIGIRIRYLKRAWSEWYLRRVRYERDNYGFGGIQWRD